MAYILGVGIAFGLLLIEQLTCFGVGDFAEAVAEPLKEVAPLERGLHRAIVLGNPLEVIGDPLTVQASPIGQPGHEDKEGPP